MYLNEAWLKLTGTSPRAAAIELSNRAERRASNPVRPDGTPVSPGEFAIDRALAGEVVRESEIILTDADGSKVWLSTNANPIQDEDGTIIGAIASSHDVTRMRRLEIEHEWARDQAQRRAQELETVLNSMADPLLITDAEGRTVMANPAYRVNLSHTAERESPDGRYERLQARSWNGDPVPREEGAVARALRGERFDSAQFLVRAADGKDMFTQTAGAPIRNSDGEIVGAVIVIHDVTERHEAEQRRDEFLSMVAHELRTPVTVVRGFAQVLMRSLRGEASPETVRRLEIIDEQAGQLARLLGELFESSRLEAEAFTCHLHPMDYKETLDTVVEEMTTLNPNRHIDVDAPGSIPVMGDRERLSQVLANLIGNAMTYSPPGTPITVSVDISASVVTTHVADDGPGVAPSERLQVFDRFYRSTDRPSPGARGIGLGLYISKRIVEAHGGQIWVEDGGRSSFAFTLKTATGP